MAKGAYKKKRDTLYYDVDAKEGDEGSRLRVPLLFVLAACAGVLADITTSKLSNATDVPLEGAASIRLTLDKCELLYVEETSVSPYLRVQLQVRAARGT